MIKRLAIIGASGHGKVIADIAELNGWNEIVFFDDAYPNVSFEKNWKVVGSTANLILMKEDFDGFIVAIGDNAIRLDKTNMLISKGLNAVSLIHPNAVISKYVSIDVGSVIMAGAIINPFVKIAKAAIINTASSIDHDCVLSDGVHVSPGVCLAGSVEVGELAWLGIGSVVKQCVKIGKNAVVGAGAVVIKDIPNHVTVMGNPAKIKF